MERSSCTSNCWATAFPHLKFHKNAQGPTATCGGRGRGGKADVQFPHLWFSTLHVTTESKWCLFIRTGGKSGTSIGEAILVGSWQIVRVWRRQVTVIEVRKATRRESVDLYVDGDAARRLSAVFQTVPDGLGPNVRYRTYRRLVDGHTPLRPAVAGWCRHWTCRFTHHPWLLPCDAMHKHVSEWVSSFLTAHQHKKLFMPSPIQGLCDNWWEWK